MDTFTQDLRYAVRALIRSPGFALVAILTLALGIGANSAIFSVVKALLLRDMPGVEQPEELVAVYTSDFSSGLYGSSSFPDYADYRDQATRFAGLAAYSFPMDATLGTTTDPQRVTTLFVTGNYFDLLGVDPLVGRMFGPADAEPGAPPLAVISSALWRQRYGADPSVVGRTINLNGQAVTIAGVASKDFGGTSLSTAPEVWIPMSSIAIMGRGDELLSERGSRWLGMIGRLTPGASLAQAEEQIRTIAARLGGAYPDTNLGTLQSPDQPRPMTLVPASEAMIDPSARENAVRMSWMLMAVVGLVLLIACANLANLLLARATGRAREMAVRVSLGAGPRRILRQLLTESMLLALIGAGAGLILAQWLSTAILRSLSSSFAVPEALPSATLDVGVLAFTVAIALLAGLLFGLAPALRAMRSSISGTLRDGGAGSSGVTRGFGLRGALVIGQIALALILLIGTGLFIQSLRQTLAVDPGYTLDDAMLASLDLSSADYSPERGLALYDDLGQRVESLPGVQSAAFAAVVPVSPAGSRTTVTINEYEPRPGEDMELNFNTVSDSFFGTMGITPVAGRVFTESDREGASPVMVVNETFASRYWGGAGAVGRYVRFEGPESEPVEVVGVVRDGKYRSLHEEPMPYMYLPLAQSYSPRMNLIVATAGDPMALARSARAELARLDPNLPLVDIRSLSDDQASLVMTEQAVTTLVTAFGVLALLLAVLGIYGVMSFLVTQRTREIGVRMALGARTMDTVALVMRNGLTLTFAGLAVGAVAALFATRFISGFLYGVSASDPAIYLLTTCLLAAAAALASYLPARRAANVDPMSALRAE
ncbi:MAG TPA: ABC transporter permease [Longimicrobiaceae bacterium]|nr:ABC transporter permease [Longimicrobiaceae bacterium]